jgi:hypothetical protein
MSGITIHTSSPITAAKPSGITPQTVSSEGQPLSAAPARNSSTPTTTTTSSSTYQPSYRQAAPGQAPTPAPTSSVSRPAQQPTATPTMTSTTSSYDGPPAPQPGPTPSPFTRTYSTTTSLPPPPKAGEKPQPAEYYTRERSPAPTRSYPPQASIPPPASHSFGQPPGSTTSTTNVPSYPYSSPNPMFGTQSHAQAPPTHTAPLGVQGVGADPRRPSFEHPPGYVQNPYASAQQYNQRNESPSLGYSVGSSYNNGVHDGEGLSLWDTAKSWAKSAGEKASQVETDIWRRINKD